MKNNPLLCVVMLYFTCLTSACNQTIDDPDWKNPLPAYPDSLTFTKISSKEFFLDGPTILRNESFQFNDRINSVVAYNSANSDLVFFRYETGEMMRKLNLVKAGILPHGKGVLKPYSFKIVNYDSIFFYDQKENNIVFFDSSRKVIRVYKVKSNKNGYSAGRLLSGMILPVANGHVYIASAPGRDPLNMQSPLRENLFLDVSLRDNHTRPFVKYPDIYGKAKWGYYLHAFYSAFNENSGQLIISYPIEHSIFVIDSSGNGTRYYAGGKDVTKVIPFRYAKQNDKIKAQEELRHFIAQPRYGSIVYDKYRELYYRIVCTSVPEKDFSIMGTPGYLRAPFSIIILNSAFEKIGEVPFDSNKYSTTSLFVSPDGLCLPTTKSSDDKMVFDVFKPAKK